MQTIQFDDPIDAISKIGVSAFMDMVLNGGNNASNEVTAECIVRAGFIHWVNTLPTIQDLQLRIAKNELKKRIRGAGY